MSHITQCWGKTKFGNWAAADRVRRAMTRHRHTPRGRRKLDIYRCRFCGCFHVGGNVRELT